MTTEAKEEQLFQHWYLELGKVGDPLNRPYLTFDSFKAGYAAGIAQANRGRIEDERSYEHDPDIGPDGICRICGKYEPE